MKRVLCYGDSNTWGWPPGGGYRYPKSQRWPGVLQLGLGGGFEIIELGQPGRLLKFGSTTVEEEHAPLLELLQRDCDIDLVIIMLGTNDIISRPEQSPGQITEDLRDIIRSILEMDLLKGSVAPIVLLIAPPLLENTEQDRFGGFDDIAVEKSSALRVCYKKLADELGCAFFDASDVIYASPLDGVHLEADAHRSLGEALVPICQNLLESSTQNLKTN